MVLLFDIGNTHTHLAVGDREKIVRHTNVPTPDWLSGGADELAIQFAGETTFERAVVASVVPRATPYVARLVTKQWRAPVWQLTAATAKGVGIDYPEPETIGADRIANAIAAKKHYGNPSVVVDFGTAVTFDVVDAKGDYVGGIITPGLAAMTDYLHEKTALLPRIEIQEVNSIIGKSTREAMLIGAVHGYRGLIRELVAALQQELNCQKMPVIATGGYAQLMAAKLPQITAVEPLLTLEGLRLEAFAEN